mgnify:CR=1 FL=1
MFSTAAGALPWVIPLLARQTRRRCGASTSACDGLFLPGGVDIDPAAYGGAAHVALRPGRSGRATGPSCCSCAGRWPTRSRCSRSAAGAQLVNVAVGGALYQDVGGATPRRRSSTITFRSAAGGATSWRTRSRIVAGSRLQRAARRRIAPAVNSMHHQGIARLAPGSRRRSRTSPRRL